MAPPLLLSKIFIISAVYSLFFVFFCLLCLIFHVIVFVHRGWSRSLKPSVGDFFPPQRLGTRLAHSVAASKKTKCGSAVVPPTFVVS